MKRLIGIGVVLATLCIIGYAGRPFVVVLGMGQDAGIPQIGCDSPFCKKAWQNQSLRRMVASIALVDPDSGERWIFDATPDLPEQFESLRSITGDNSVRIDGIFLTHAHIGHYTGLMYLGREAMNANSVKVFAMPRMRKMLESNAPWSQLVSLKNIVLSPLEDSASTRLNSRISVEPFLVPHRDEFSETVGFRIKTDAKTFVYIPDIDKWEKWPTPLADVVRSSDYVLVDGTFYADGEINRPMSEVPHPFVSETMEILKGLSIAERSRVVFIHFNHSNPLVQGNRAKLAEIKKQGFSAAVQGERFQL